MYQTQNDEVWIFLSHSNKDYEKVRLVRNVLEGQSLRPLMFFLHCLSDDEEGSDNSDDNRCHQGAGSKLYIRYKL